MHWSEEIAKSLIERNPDKEEYVCAAGTSPSGSVHIGNFRDIATSYFVVKALQKMGRRARLLFSWDEFDRFRKVPVNVKAVAPDFEKYIGMPYSDVPDPFGCCESYAKHFEKEYEAALKKFGIPVDFRYQADEYRSGRYAEDVIRAIEKRGEIFDILDSFRTQDAQAGEREAYYPVSIYCPACGKDETTILSVSDDCSRAEYVCACGHRGSYDFRRDFNCKLAWKIDWPMRWRAEGVDFEPGGKDHASPTGSYQTSRKISRAVYDYEAPLFQGYEFIGIKGTTGKMSGSSGLNLTPEALLKIYQPEVILWLYSKTVPTKAFDFCFDEEILRQYFEFDKMYSAWRDGTADEATQAVMYNVQVGDRTVNTVSMQNLASFGSIVDFNPVMMETIFRKIGQNYTQADFAERLELARYWMEKCSPESMTRLLPENNTAYYEALPAENKREIALLAAYIAKGGYGLDELNTFLYSVPVQVFGEMDDKEKKQRQGVFFRNVYNLLIGKPKGPRLYLFLYAVEPEKYLHLLQF